ncbi:MAG TPA: DUF4019 domain-containing protein [Bryobacteraceae bacterium]|nr:DUF4019 domain-containing protein [Bryobacteraceae bacterium]
MTLRRLAPSVLLALTLGPVFAQSDAQKHAESWLSLVDNRQYAESWTEASAYFRARVARQQWVDMVKSVREPIGALKSRKTLKITTATSLPGAPDGEYTVIQFQSSFQNKASAVETLTLMKDGGQWRPAGYFIR